MGGGGGVRGVALDECGHRAQLRPQHLRLAPHAGHALVQSDLEVLCRALADGQRRRQHVALGLGALPCAFVLGALAIACGGRLDRLGLRRLRAPNRRTSANQHLPLLRLALRQPLGDGGPLGLPQLVLLAQHAGFLAMQPEQLVRLEQLRYAFRL